MEIQGKVVHNLGIESGTGKSGKAWSKASIVVETQGQYPRKIVMTNFKSPAEFAKLTVGTEGTFHIDLESREWKNPTTGKSSWFTEVGCWKWEIAASAAPQVPTPATPAIVDASQPDPLPF